jgi:hypothetical protein
VAGVVQLKKRGLDPLTPQEGVKDMMTTNLNASLPQMRVIVPVNIQLQNQVEDGDKPLQRIDVAEKITKMIDILQNLLKVGEIDQLKDPQTDDQLLQPLLIGVVGDGNLLLSLVVDQEGKREMIVPGTIVTDLLIVGKHLLIMQRDPAVYHLLNQGVDSRTLQ